MAGHKNKTAEQISAQIFEVLKDEGFGVKSVDYEEDNNIDMIPFKKEGLNLLIIVDHDDVGYVQIILPNFFSLDDEKEKINGYLCASIVSSRLKCVKVYVNKTGDDMMATVEYIQSSTEINKEALLRYINSVASAGRSFAQEMRVISS